MRRKKRKGFVLFGRRGHAAPQSTRWQWNSKKEYVVLDRGRRLPLRYSTKVYLLWVGVMVYGRFKKEEGKEKCENKQRKETGP